MTTTMPAPRLHRAGPVSGASAVVLVLPGGRATSLEESPRGLAYLRMVPFTWAARRPNVAVWLLRYRYRGWNEPYEHPVADVRWALEMAASAHPDARVTLVGHSMGGRAALRAADTDQVDGVCALAPWINADEPYAHLVGRRLLIAHGTADRVTDPRQSARLARQVGAEYVPVTGDTHAMLRHPRVWSELVRRFTSPTA